MACITSTPPDPRIGLIVASLARQGARMVVGRASPLR
jgi:hypothetical protein